MYCSAPARLVMKSLSRITGSMVLRVRSEGPVRRLGFQSSAPRTFSESHRISQNEQQFVDAGVANERRGHRDQQDIPAAALERAEPKACANVGIGTAPAARVGAANRSGVDVCDEPGLDES